MALVALGVAKLTAWQAFPEAMQADIWNVSNALWATALLALIGLLYASKAMFLTVSMLAGFELQTAACSIGYIVKPWPMNPGDELCSAGLQFPIALVSLWAAVCLTLYLRGAK